MALYLSSTSVFRVALQGVTQMEIKACKGGMVHHVNRFS